MKELVADTEADAHALPIILVAVALASFLFISLSIGVNYMTDYMNDGIAAGTVSAQTESHYGNIVLVFSGILLFVLLDIIIWTINRVQMTRDREEY